LFFLRTTLYIRRRTYRSPPPPRGFHGHKNDHKFKFCEVLHIHQQRKELEAYLSVYENRKLHKKIT
jgi:hypothetical protein